MDVRIAVARIGVRVVLWLRWRGILVIMPRMEVDGAVRLEWLRVLLRLYNGLNVTVYQKIRS